MQFVAFFLLRQLAHIKMAEASNWPLSTAENENKAASTTRIGSKEMFPYLAMCFFSSVS